MNLVRSSLLTVAITGLLTAQALQADATIPANLVADGIPALPDSLREEAGRYLEFRAAAFQGWHPERREALILTRFADAAQVHRLKMPGGARQQLTFTSEPVHGAAYRRGSGASILIEQDTGGGENFQLHRFDPKTGKMARLTDGKSRNTGPVWSPKGSRIAWTSTQRTGSDTDIWIMEEGRPETAKLALERKGGGWAVLDWAPDESALLLEEFVSANESRLHLLTLAGATVKELTPKPGSTAEVWSGGKFSPDGKTIYTTSDASAEFRQLVALRLGGEKATPKVLTGGISWDVEAFDLSPDGKTVAIVTNEDGASVLRLIDAADGHELKKPKLPMGVISGVEWHDNGRDVGFTFTGARSPSDMWSVDATTGELTRWTESETGGMDATGFVEPELVRVKAADGLGISGFLYKPDEKRFPGPRPVMVIIHGGPEGQSRPIFLGRNNFYLEELGCALLFPNVRGSEGYGKKFLALDNGFQREDSVKDIGAFLDWIGTQPGLDARRVAVMGGSYGGYMTLACLTHYSPRLRCGIDIVGISNFLSFLQNTAGYRRDLRRVEYGDERDPKMAEHLKTISPLTNVAKIQVPLFVVQGANDPRVPASEAEQIVKAVRGAQKPCWYLLAKDEGHGFAKKPNQDYQFQAQIQFLREHLLK